MPWNLTVRTGGKVSRARFDELTAALEAVEDEASSAAENAPRKPVDAKIRTFEPAQLVVARVELTGPERLLPKVKAGIDVRGDGSSEAYLGGVRRKLIDQRRRETPVDALRRTLADAGIT